MLGYSNPYETKKNGGSSRFVLTKNVAAAQVDMDKRHNDIVFLRGSCIDIGKIFLFAKVLFSNSKSFFLSVISFVLRSL